MGRIICLADSRKHGLHCVAGVDPRTGKWVRPVSRHPDGALHPGDILVEGRQLSILDIIEFPERDAPAVDFGFQPENVLIGPGRWEIVGRASAEEVLAFCESSRVLLHNAYDRVSYRYLQGLPRDRWKSLQLVRATRLCFRMVRRPGKADQCRAGFAYPPGGRTRYDLPLTDPVWERVVADGRAGRSECIFAVSLGMPFSPDDREPACFKLVAGVIRL